MAEVKYILIAEIDGEIVFKSSYPDTAYLEENLHKVEKLVEQYLEEDSELIRKLNE